MAQNLFEAYKTRLSIAESVYSRSHNGDKLDNNRKLVLATVLKNTNAFLNESLNSGAATQRSDMADYKKFCLNLTTVALPNLIANDLVIVHPMTSMTGYITYVNYVAGTEKGDIDQGHLFNNPFQLGEVGNAEYTADRVTETFASGQLTLGWTPVLQGAFKDADGNVLGDVKVVSGSTTVFGTFADADSAQSGTLASMTFVDDTGASATHTFAADDKIYYVYDNIVIPQKKLPTLKAEMKAIQLFAKARRIAVYYSQIAAFQAKTDYGFDLGDQLAEKAVGQLSYEIDTEVVQLLADTAGAPNAALAWSKTLPVGVSKKEHYEGFSEIVEIGRQLIYDQTRRFAPNYMIIASDVLPVLTFINGFTAAPAGQVNGPYFAGTLNSLKVYVSPALKPGQYCIGCNGEDMMSSVAVYAPYMAIVPTQLVQFADGGTQQGFSTLYDLKVLNANLIVKGEIS